MDDRQTQQERNEDHKALATADLAGTEPRDSTDVERQAPRQDRKGG